MRFLFAILLVAASTTVHGQNIFRIGPGVLIGEENQLHELILVDYSKLLGTCLDIDEKTVYFRLREASEVTVIPKNEVRFLGLYDVPTSQSITTRNGRIKPRIPESGRPAFTDATYHRTALPTLGKGQYRNLNAIYNVAEFKLSDNFQLGAGVLVPFGFLTTQRLRFGLGEDLHFGLSNQALMVTIELGPLFLVGDLNANFTLGNENRFLNFGGGFFYNTDDTERLAHFNVSLGGRISEQWHIYGEMSVIDDGFDVIVMPAFSAAHTIRRHRWRYGFFNVLTPFDGPLIPLPFIGYEFHW
ncbi:hypothetical protein CEQ90_09865 [Lewinellaceae bacterium SD302]|nr:hypothetical protein CEQ90_09865 [Lewinellaceae bacterium SD302]